MNIRDVDGDLDTNPLMDIPPEDPVEIAIIKDNALYSPLIRDNFINEEGNVTAINVTIENIVDEPSYNQRVFADIEALVEPLKGEFDNIFQVGPPRLNVEIERGMFADMQTLSPISTIILIGSIILFLRTPMAACLPMATAGISIFWSIGFMGFVGIPLTLLTAILPSLVVVIGSTEDTHMLASYLHGLPNDKSKDTRQIAIRTMARHVGLPIFITSFTTVIGFLSNALSDIEMIQNFAYATSFAMLANLAATILVLPLLLSIFGPVKSKLSNEESPESGFVYNTMKALEGISEKHEKKIAVSVCLAMIFLLVQAFSVTVSNDPLSYFKDDNQIIADAETLHENLSGMQVFYLVINAEDGHDFKDPDQLKKVEKIIQFMIAQGVYDKVISITDHLSLVNQEMNGGNKTFYRVPDSRNLIEQYLLLFQRDDIGRYLSADSEQTNILVRHNVSDSSQLNKYLDELEVISKDILGETMPHVFTGKNLMINRAAESLFSSQIDSLALLVVIIFLIMAVLYTSITAGFLSLLPNLIPIITMFGVMGILDIPLNPGTATVAVIAVGIAIDDTIHLISSYNAECKKDPDQVAAARRAVWHQAIPVISTSLALSAGFIIMMFSNFNIVAQFGLLSALTILVAMFSDLLVTPILLKRLRLVGIWDIVGLKVSRDVLYESELFEGMSKFQIRKTILLSQMQEFGSGEVVIKQGDHESDMFLVLAGEVAIIFWNGENDRRIAKCSSGQVFGEVGFSGDIERTATVKTITDATLLRFDAEKVASSLRFYPRIAAKLNGNISKILGRHLAERGASTRPSEELSFEGPSI